VDLTDREMRHNVETYRNNMLPFAKGDSSRRDLARMDRR
jgi:hypothetical protein